jgi:SAM-dependent methyltransferase
MAGYRAFERVGVCPLCGSVRFRVIDETASVVRCSDCGHRFVDPRPTQAEISRGYSLPEAYDTWLVEAAARERLWRRRFTTVFAAVPPGRLLDVGAGVGTFLSIARDAGWEPQGTEVSSTAIEHARELGIILRSGELATAGVEGPFDAITLWHVVEHVQEPAATLRLCRSLLRSDGRLVMAMPNDGGASNALSIAGNAIRRTLRRPQYPRYLVLAPGVESHIQHFDVGSISRLLRAEGFRIDRVDVDDASPTRSRLGRSIFEVRRWLTRWTPWHWGREMLVIARPAPKES